ncbi:hypothetical protein ACXNSR_10655 [Streptomyces sp. NC-S4]
MCDAFHVDGSLRDITVTDTDDTDWNQVLPHLRATADQLTWHHGTEAHDIGPDDTENPIATLEDDHVATLGVRYGRTWFSAHLPVDGIEFSLWPDDIEDGAHVTDVLRFLTALGTACDRPAVLTAETVTGHHELPPLITYTPSTRTTTHR